MTYPTESFAGAAVPSYLTATLSASAMSGTFHGLSTWTELGTANPLGTSGNFVIVVDYGKTTEEKIRCSALNPSTGVITFVQRGYDDTTPAVHAIGSATSPNCFPVLSASDVDALQDQIATKLPLAGGTLTGALNGTTATFTGEVKGSDFAPTGLTGATAASRYVGGTVSGAPTTGTFAVGDFVIDQSATIWVCIGAGSPGTWSPTESQSVISTGVSLTAKVGQVVVVTGGSTGITITLPASPTEGSTFGIVNNNNNAISIKGGSWPMLIAGSNYGAGISYTVSPAGAYLFVFDNVGNRWICTTTNDIGDMVNYGDVALSKFGAAAANVSLGGHKVTNLANGTASTDAAAFGQIPTSLPPSGSAGGDLTGSYPNPSVVAGSTTVAGKLQLTDSTSSTSITTAATPNAVKSAYDLANTKVASVTAGDTTITVAGTATAPTVAVAQANLTIAESQVTNLITDLAAKVPTSRTISTTAPLSGGGDLSANRTLSIADASTTVKGAVQLTDSVSSTSTTTAATPNSVKSAYDLANAALPKSGGTMSGNINMNSVARLTNLLRPSALGQPMRVDEATGILGPGFFSQNPVYGWTILPELIISGAALTMTTSTVYVIAMTVPYDTTATGVRFFLNTQGTNISAANITLMNATTSLATVNAPATAFNSASNTLVSTPFTATASLTAGTYWIAFSATFTGTAPVLACGGNQTQSTTYNMNQTATTNSLATTRVGSGITIPAVGSSLTTTPSQNIPRLPFFGIY